MASNSAIDANRGRSLLAVDIVSGLTSAINSFNLVGAQALAVALVDGSGSQIISFGGGTQYADAAAAVAHPTGTGIIFNNGGTYNFVSAAQPLPITGSLSITNPSTGAAVPATANYIAASKAGTLTGILLGSQTGANSLGVVLASDQAALAVTGTFWQNTQPVSVASLPSVAVTNAGTFAVQSTPITQVDTFMLGGVNIKEVNAVTPLMGNGATGTGSLRVTIASDNTAFAVNSTLSAETTKVIGVVRTSDGAGNLLTSNSTTYTAKFGLDGNLLGTLGTAFSTAGKIDVKAADGDVFVQQTTAANLNATVIGTGTFAVQDTPDWIKHNWPCKTHGWNK
jgi:hypothetical protein